MCLCGCGCETVSVNLCLETSEQVGDCLGVGVCVGVRVCIRAHVRVCVSNAFASLHLCVCASVTILSH